MVNPQIKNAAETCFCVTNFYSLKHSGPGEPWLRVWCCWIFFLEFFCFYIIWSASCIQLSTAVWLRYFITVICMAKLCTVLLGADWLCASLR